jgi:hypothetical protein
MTWLTPCRHWHWFPARIQYHPVCVDERGRFRDMIWDPRWILDMKVASESFGLGLYMEACIEAWRMMMAGRRPGLGEVSDVNNYATGYK